MDVQLFWEINYIDKVYYFIETAIKTKIPNTNPPSVSIDRPPKVWFDNFVRDAKIIVTLLENHTISKVYAHPITEETLAR